ncbi:MAG: hypothetical protein LN545_02970 [Candidatus Megaira endosymbiont of Carteria cerasiformis]|nr:hypothetical protein [Candidatus Megaera polyxenophila]MCC8460944.1 hypothetical protein [Candidatus Megaera polyxenophila]
MLSSPAEEADSSSWTDDFDSVGSPTRRNNGEVLNEFLDLLSLVAQKKGQLRGMPQVDTDSNSESSWTTVSANEADEAVTVNTQLNPSLIEPKAHTASYVASDTDSSENKAYPELA